jgi:hypothetical protein
MRFEHQNLCGVWGRHQGFMVSPPSGFCPWSHGALVLQSLDMSVFDMAFYPVPVEIRGDLLFLGPGSAILLFLFGPAIVFLFYCLFRGSSRHLIFSLRCDVLWIGLRRRRMGGVSRLMQWRIFFLGVGRMAGRGFWIHVDGGMKVCSRYEM